VVVTTWTRSCAIPGDARTQSAIVKAKRNAMDLVRKGPRSRGLFLVFN
jgi:hypothetical protein